MKDPVDFVVEEASRPGYCGFTAASCCVCKAKVNALANQHFHCPGCGAWNKLEAPTPVPHEAPDYGPHQVHIKQAMRRMSTDRRPFSRCFEQEYDV